MEKKLFDKKRELLEVAAQCKTAYLYIIQYCKDQTREKLENNQMLKNLMEQCQAKLNMMKI